MTYHPSTDSLNARCGASHLKADEMTHNPWQREVEAGMVAASIAVRQARISEAISAVRDGGSDERSYWLRGMEQPVRFTSDLVADEAFWSSVLETLRYWSDRAGMAAELQRHG